MPKVRIHIRLSTENYDFLAEFSRQHFDLGINKALNVILDTARSEKLDCGPLGPQRPTRGLKVDSPRQKS
jgi:hypothetical protein